MSPSKHTIRLTQVEMMNAAQTGVIRQIQNIRDDRKPAFGAGSKNDWQLHIEGCLGEAAVAKALNCYWAGRFCFRGDDVQGIQVRTRSKAHYELILHKEDDDEKPFVLVTGRNGVYVIHGWIFGREGKREEYWKDPAEGRPAFFVPQRVLKPMSALPQQPTDRQAAR